jgi:hypothetical protein
MSGEAEVRQFQVEFPEAQLAELRRRINATRWPEHEREQPDLFASEMRATFRSLR